MALSAGTRLGPYEILAPLGAGGMGEVYRARDTRLDRTVAIKVLQTGLSASDEVRARFEREARAVSSLNHPHICVLHDLGREHGIDYLVLEHLEGETLAARLARGALSPDELLQVAVPIADALDKAHRKGLVHRDLKPANIMLTKSGAKLLDFGLARTTGLGDAGAALSRSPTISKSLTAEGTIVGTFQYLAPEVLEGAETDARADIFAFGATLFEMASGKRAFEGKSQASVIAAILEREPPPLSTVQPMAPPALERLVKLCLAKDPDERIQSMHDVLLQLRWIQEGGSRAGVAAPAAARRRSRARLAWVVAGVATAAAVAFAVEYVRRAPPKLEPIRFQFPSPNAIARGGSPRISPDGRYVAFEAVDTTGSAALWVRPLAALAAHAIPGADATRRPFWSPDSRQLAFFAAGNRLKKVGVEGGVAQTICEASGGADGTWGKRGVILFDGGSRDSIRRVSAAGGVAGPASRIDRAHGELGHAWPQFLPDGEHFLFLAFSGKAESTWIKVGKLGSLESKPLTVGAYSRIEFAPPGYVLFARDRALLAQPFDPGRLRFTGEPVPVADDVEADIGPGNAEFSASGNGILALRGASSGGSARLVWKDRTGADLGVMGDPGDYQSVELSPDGERAAVTVGPSLSTSDVWIVEQGRGVASRLTFDEQSDLWPIWSPDGSQIAFASNRAGSYRIFLKRSDGAGQEEALSPEGIHDVGATDWSPDGAILLAARNVPDTRWDILIQPLQAGQVPVPFLVTPSSEMMGRFSPDGRWIAYDSRESGRYEIYVRPYPGPGGKYQISTQGGADVRWRRDGKELFYLTAQGDLMAVDVTTTPAFRPGPPRRLFRAVPPSELDGPVYGVAPDGQRFLVLVPQQQRALPPTTVIVNWTSGLRRN